VVVPCIYDGVGDFSEGLAAANPGGKSGYINTQGEVVVPCIYDAAWPFSDGLAKVLQNDKWSIINTQGKVIVAECDYWNTRWSKVAKD
jgi:serine/threonine-protein kinase